MEQDISPDDHRVSAHPEDARATSAADLRSRAHRAPTEAEQSGHRLRQTTDTGMTGLRSAFPMRINGRKG